MSKPKSRLDWKYLIVTSDEDGYIYSRCSSKTKKFDKRFASKNRRRNDKKIIKEDTVCI